MKINGTVYRVGDLYEKNPVKISDLRPGESIKIVRENGDVKSTLFTVYRPPRHRNESPIEYYKRTKCVDDRYTHRYRGLYYCHPSHCRRTWSNKKNRDEHLKMAWALLN